MMSALPVDCPPSPGGVSKPAVFHKYIHIPTPRITTYNANGYSSAVLSGSGLLRRRKLRANLRSLALGSDVLMTQETRTVARCPGSCSCSHAACDSEERICPAVDSPFYTDFLPGFLRYSNPNPDSSRSAGTDMWIAHRFADSFQIVHSILVPGFIQSLRLVPRSGTALFSKSFSITNVYLPSGNDKDTSISRLSMLQRLTEFHYDSTVLFFGGDWNLTEAAADSAGNDHFASDTKNRSALSTFRSTLSLKEVYQPSHTRFKGTQSARLDRFYTSLEIPEMCLMEPLASLPHHSYQPGQGLHKGPSDHYPVRLSFHPPNLAAGVTFKIPEWLASHPDLKVAIMEQQALVQEPDHPVKAWLRLKRTISLEARRLMRSLGATALTRAQRLTRRIKAFRQLHLGTPPATVLCACGGDEELASAVEGLDGVADLTPIKKLVDDILKTTPSPDPIRRGSNALSRAKQALPGSMLKLSFLERSDGSCIYDSQSMAKEIKACWSPIWNKPEPDPARIQDYLSDYNKYLKSSPLALTLESVQECLAKPRRSSTGPDGIPFAIYRLILDLAAPRFLRMVEYLAAGNQPWRSFNFGNVFFSPKKPRPLVGDLRLLTVNNTDNRLVAKAVASRIVPAMQEILCSRQHAFRKGANLESLIKQLNDRFYRALGEGERVVEFLHDFNKAYDSASRAFLLTLMHRIGLPIYYINIIKALWLKNTGFPILLEKCKTKFDMSNGLKQGCPLSPPLFVLFLDPLLTRIDKLRSKHGCLSLSGYADDLDAQFQDWGALVPMLKQIDMFNHASGSSSNFSKSKLISTVDDELPLALPGHWADIKLMSKAKHLGIWRGRSMTITDHFEGPLHKLACKVASFMPYKKYFSIQTRVIISNSFLSTIPSFVFNFFKIAEKDLVEARRLISEWVIPGRRFTYTQLTAPTKKVGLAQPLHDLLHLNLAGLIAGLNSLEFEPLPVPSLIHSNQVALACAVFLKIANKPPLLDSDFRSLRSQLHNCDKASWFALCAKVQGTGRRRVMDADSAATIATTMTDNTQLLPGGLKPVIRSHVFLLCHNALPTRTRDRWRHGQDVCCSMCGMSEESLAHLHECPVTRTALSFILNASQNPDQFIDLTRSTGEDFLLRTPCHDKELLLQRVTLSYAMWTTRSSLWHMDTSADSRGKRASLLATLFTESLSKPRRLYKKRPRTEAVAAYQSIRETLSPSTIIVFPDGSSVGNPGPSGAGFTIKFPSKERLFCSLSLGEATNNRAELVALEAACNLTADELEKLKPLDAAGLSVAVFVDNMYTIKIGDGIWLAKTNKALCLAAARAVARLRTLSPTTLYWVPAHEGIEENELADCMAKRGAAGISSDLPPSPADLERARHVSSFAAPAPTHLDEKLPLSDLHPPPPHSPSSPAPPPARILRKRISSSKLVELGGVGIDFSWSHHPKKRLKTQEQPMILPVTCKHGVPYVYEGFNLKIDLLSSALSCQECSDATFRNCTLLAYPPPTGFPHEWPPGYDEDGLPQDPDLLKTGYFDYPP